jgi:hypothetical protein
MYKIIDLDIDESLSADTKVDAVALVEMPAIETEFIYFTNQEFQEKTFRVTNEISANACKARKYKQENPNRTCGTNVGWTRSSQLCDKKPISLDTVKRMYSYLSRHKIDLISSKSYEDGCGLLMYDCWGGKEALIWSKRILQQEKEFDINVEALPEYDYYPTGDTKDNMLVEPIAFIEKVPYERKEDYISRCIEYHIKEKGYEPDQAAAICYSQAEEAFDCGCNQEYKEEGDPCWEGYEMIGMKIVDGKEVPNCVPIEEGFNFPTFDTPEEAIQYGKEHYECDGYHEHTDENGKTIYMPCDSHDDLSDWSEEDLEMKQCFDELFKSKDFDFGRVTNELLVGYTREEIARFNHKNPTKYYLYKKVVQPLSSDSRDFCDQLEGKFFRRGQIYGLEQFNNEFGHNKQPYSKWLFKGGPQCVHAWEEWSAVRDQIRNDGMVPGTPGVAPQEMIGKGYYPGTPRYEANLSSVCTENCELSKDEIDRHKLFEFRTDDEQRMLYSPLMVPNILIPRIDNNEKYFVRFTPKAIEKIQRKFMIEQRLRQTNLEHDNGHTFNDMVMVESWLVNGKSDKAFTIGYKPNEIPQGTWMVGYKILDTPEGDVIWNDFIKTGKVKGLSAEGAFLMNFQQIKTHDYLLQEIINILNQIN